MTTPDPNRLRGLTVQQPHAWAIARGFKDVENRGWPFPLPLGTVIAVHAGCRVDPDGLDVTVDEQPDLVHGVIVALAEIVDCRVDSTSRWAIRGEHHWIIGTVRQLVTPIPCRGNLSLWGVPSAIAERVCSAETRITRRHP